MKLIKLYYSALIVREFIYLACLFSKKSQQSENCSTLNTSFPRCASPCKSSCLETMCYISEYNSAKVWWIHLCACQYDVDMSIIQDAIYECIVYIQMTALNVANYVLRCRIVISTKGISAISIVLT